MGPVAQYHLSTTISMQNLIVFCIIAALAAVNCMPVCENGKIVQSDDGNYECKCNDNFVLNGDGNCIEAAQRKRRSQDCDDNMVEVNGVCECIQTGANGECVEIPAQRKRRSEDCDDNMVEVNGVCECIQ